MSNESACPGKLTIGVLYGFRALMVLFVCQYHFWQQSWLPQYFPLLGETLDLDFWTRSGYLFVDGMLLLSGFLLYLPYARQKETGAPVPGVKRFYWNRLVRILPSYLFNLAVVLFLFVLPGGYPDAAARNRDLLAHLTFTFPFWAETYLQTPLNGVLWTVAVEMQLYLLFPWLARAAQKKPALTLGGMAAGGLLYRWLVARDTANLPLLINQMPSFLDVYALGMLGAIVYVRLLRLTEESLVKRELRCALAILTPALFALGCRMLVELVRAQTGQGLVSREALCLSQLRLRLPLAATLLLMMLSASFWPRWLQKTLDNRLTRFLSTISLNLYLWHQILSVQLAQKLFPPSLHSDLNLQWAFTLLCYSLSILVAMIATYGVEQPAARLAGRAWQALSARRARSLPPAPEGDGPRG